MQAKWQFAGRLRLDVWGLGVTGSRQPAFVKAQKQEEAELKPWKSSGSGVQTEGSLLTRGGVGVGGCEPR